MSHKQEPESCAEKLKVCVKDKDKEIDEESKTVCCNCENDDTADRFPDEEMVRITNEYIKPEEIAEVGEEGE